VSVDVEALAIAMALVPGVLSRNRCFDLYGDARLRRARSRASLLRGLVRQLGGASGAVADLGISRHAAGGCEVRFRIEGIALSRRVLVSDLEASCLRYLAHKTGGKHLTPTEGDRAAIEGALRRLAIGLGGIEAAPD
jgi:hypothetical protein